MNWEKQLESKILNNDDKNIFNEAVRCLNNSCYRAGYIISWISIVENYKRKLFEASVSGDKQAEDSWQKIANLEKQKKSIDQQILEEIRKNNFIDNDEIEKLNFLYNQRCIFAHPYEKEPTGNELRYIISQSVEIALSKGIIYKKSFINKLIDDFYNKPYYLPLNKTAIINYAKRVLPRVDKNLFPYFFKSLYGKVGELIEKSKESDYVLQRYILFINEIFKESDLPLSDSAWRLEDLTLKHPYTASVVFINNENWFLIPSRVKEILTEYVIQDDYSAKIEYARSAMSNFISKSNIEKEYYDKFNELLDKRPFTEISYLNFDYAKLYNRLIDELSSGDFYCQRDIIRFLENEKGKELLKSLNYKQLRKLGKEITFAAEHGCWEAQSFLKKIKFNEWQFDFCFGLFLGCFFDRSGIINIKENYLRSILFQINEFCKTKIDRIFTRTKNKLSSADNKSLYDLDVQSIENEYNKIETDTLSQEIRSHFEGLIEILKKRMKIF